MSQELRDLMTRLADAAPTARVDESLWHEARGLRRRQRLALPLAALLVLAGVFMTAWLGPGWPSSERTAAPAGGSVEPAVPTRVYPVPEHLDGERDGTWTYARAATLKVGTAAVAFTTERGAPVVVSALDGGYHLLDLPGLDPDSAFMFGDGVLALSPDGERLAYTWNKSPSRTRDGDRYVPSGVRVVDLGTGEVTSFQVRKAYGVFSHGLAWSPDGRYLVYNTQIANTSQSGTHGRRFFFVERLDTATGERLQADGIPTPASRPRSRTRAPSTAHLRHGLGVWRPGVRAVAVDVPTRSDWGLTGVSPLSGNTVVLVDGQDHATLLAGSAEPQGSFRRVGSAPGGLRLLGPVSGDTVAFLSRGAETSTLRTVDVAGRRSAVLVEIEDDDVLDGGHSFATALLDRPPRDFPAPDWPMSIETKLLLGAAAAAAAVAAGWLCRRYLTRSGVRRLTRSVG